MWVHSAASNQGVDGNENCQYCSENRLHDDQNNSRDRLGRLRNAELLDKDQNAKHGKHSDDLNDDIDPVSGFQAVGTRPEKEDEHDRFNGELSDCLNHAVAITTSNDATFSEHVDDRGNKHPPVTLLETVVEEAVFDPGFLVVVQSGGVAFKLLVLACETPDSP